jgi:hypothetical protein
MLVFATWSSNSLKWARGVLKASSTSSISLVVMFDFASTHCTRSLHVSEAIPAGVLALMIATLAGPRLLMIADCNAALALSHFLQSALMIADCNAAIPFRTQIWRTLFVNQKHQAFEAR